MPYPMVFVSEDEAFARVNYNGSWSVDWDIAASLASQPLTNANKALVACAKVLMAAHATLVATPWEDSDEWSQRWEHREIVFDDDPEEVLDHFIISVSGQPLASVNRNGQWTFDWERIKATAERSFDHWQAIGVVAFCQLLMLAKVNLDDSDLKAQLSAASRLRAHRMPITDDKTTVHYVHVVTDEALHAVAAVQVNDSGELKTWEYPLTLSGIAGSYLDLAITLAQITHDVLCYAPVEEDDLYLGSLILGER